ncbi:hypothetical protein UFOVP48_16 [uncultured Caudovirales phage]|uniref:Uncharacterized protein n=1 Tax=uncultured Caudovirales phage TaxID=2100421 RepID=A0A6J5KQJ4_9CAUD|nr:hypothetical protein UFOVP48_16 [uncultured Caudovirales phage]
MKVEWKLTENTLYPELIINGMRVGWISPYGNGVRGVVAPKLREAIQGQPIVIICKTQEEAKAELEGVCVAILIGESYGP